jgi:uncharacterized protein YaeQ
LRSVDDLLVPIQAFQPWHRHLPWVFPIANRLYSNTFARTACAENAPVDATRTANTARMEWIRIPRPDVERVSIDVTQTGVTTAYQVTGREIRLLATQNPERSDGPTVDT